MTGSRSAAVDSGAAAIRHAPRSAASEDLFEFFMRERIDITRFIAKERYPSPIRRGVLGGSTRDATLWHFGRHRRVRRCPAQRALRAHAKNVLDLVKSRR